jgi:hypothetical protein
MIFPKAKIIGAILLSLPLVANASLTVINNTNQDSTSVINNTCSSAIGSTGITKKHTTNTVPDMAIQLVCGFTPHNCVADVRMTTDCSGASVATISFDVSTGIKTATLSAAGQQAGYSISAQGFSVQLNGGPSFK